MGTPGLADAHAQIEPCLAVGGLSSLLLGAAGETCFLAGREEQQAAPTAGCIISLFRPVSNLPAQGPLSEPNHDGQNTLLLPLSSLAEGGRW